MKHNFKKNVLPETTICLIECSSNSSHIRAYDAPTGDVIIPPTTIRSKLGQLTSEGGLNPEGMKMTLELLEECKPIIEQIPPDQIKAIGTGAMRDANNTEEFNQKIEELLGFRINILKGEQEAFYSAHAIQKEFPDANGIICDMGGRSMEFAIIQNRTIAHNSGISLPLGSMAIAEHGDNYKDHIKEQLNRLPKAYQSQAYENLYVIGGTQRRILGMEMGIKPDGDTSSVHGHTVNKDDFHHFTQGLMLQDHSQYERFNELLPYAGGVMVELLERIDVQNIIASKAGTRAGVLYLLEDIVEKKYSGPAAPQLKNDITREVTP